MSPVKPDIVPTKSGGATVCFVTATLEDAPGFVKPCCAPEPGDDPKALALNTSLADACDDLFAGNASWSEFVSKVEGALKVRHA